MGLNDGNVQSMALQHTWGLTQSWCIVGKEVHRLGLRATQVRVHNHPNQKSVCIQEIPVRVVEFLQGRGRVLLQ